MRGVPLLLVDDFMHALRYTRNYPTQLKACYRDRSIFLRPANAHPAKHAPSLPRYACMQVSVIVSKR